MLDNTKDSVRLAKANSIINPVYVVYNTLRNGVPCVINLVRSTPCLHGISHGIGNVMAGFNSMARGYILIHSFIARCICFNTGGKESYHKCGFGFINRLETLL
jgi:hypothetical protein